MKVLGRIILILIVTAAVASSIYLLVRSTGGGQDGIRAPAEFGRPDLHGRSHSGFEMDGSFSNNFEMQRGRPHEFSEFGHEDEASVGRGLAGVLGNLILIGLITFVVAKINSGLAQRSHKQGPVGTNAG